MSSSRFFTVVITLIALGAAYYLLKHNKHIDVQVPPNVELPMFSGDKVTNTSYDSNGVRSYVITSEHLEYFAQNKQTVFEKPVLLIYSEGKILEWRVTAQKGILNKNKVLTLDKNVIALNLLDGASFESMKTSVLDISLESRDFWTTKPVFLQGLQFETTGQSMKGNFKTRDALMYNHVQGRYENFTP